MTTSSLEMIEIKNLDLIEPDPGGFRQGQSLSSMTSRHRKRTVVQYGYPRGSPEPYDLDLSTERTKIGPEVTVRYTSRPPAKEQMTPGCTGHLKQNLRRSGFTNNTPD